jgi:glycosyltransferase involved in cell wall biosynthesis
MTPAISVILPVRDGGAPLRQAIDSVLAQTYADFELLVLDDGSRDGSRELARGYTDPRVRALGDASPLGVATRLNQGIDLARGRYLARMDADDVCFTERLQRQVAFLDAHPEIDLVGCRAVVFRDGGEVVGLLPFRATHEAICARPWIGLHLPHPTWLGRREWFQRFRYRLPEVWRAEDQEILLRAFPDSRFACLDEILLGYRQGRFQLRRTLRGRRSLLRVQLATFARRGQWGFAALAAGVGALKAALDCVAALPGCEQVFFTRMSEPAPRAAIEALQGLRATGGRA